MQMLGLAIGRGGMQPDAAYTQNRWGKIGQGTYDVSAACVVGRRATGEEHNSAHNEDDKMMGEDVVHSRGGGARLRTASVV